jgi:hypothetical protein
VLVTTPRAFCTNETLFQPSATQVGFKLFANKSRQPSTLLDLRFEERIGVPIHNAIQHRLFGSMAPITRSAGPRRRRANPIVLLSR